MGQVCKVCQHSNKIEINQELIQGKSKSGISRKYDVPYGSVDYHSQHHLSRQLATAYEMKELDESNNLLARIEDILSKAELIFTRNFEKEKDTIALKALSESRGALELMARIAAHLHQARAAELENTKTTFSVVVGADDEETSIFDRAADMLSSAEFAELIRLTDKIQNGNDQSISPGTEEYAYHEDPDPYPGIPQDLTVDPRPLKSTPDMDETPLSTDPEPEPEPLSESKMVRTKKPMAQIPKPIEPTQIDGPRTISAAIISRKKSGIAYLK